MDKVFHILLATMSNRLQFDSAQIDSVIDDDDEFWYVFAFYDEALGLGVVVLTILSL